MRRISLATIILLLALSYGCKADVNQDENIEHTKKVSRLEQSGETEHAEKELQLEKVAEKFKAETGFRGEISYSTELNRLGVYEGKFVDIQITADADTATFRNTFEQILDKVLPYTYAKREHLTRAKISKDTGYVRAVYFQQVNGYRVEGTGKLTIVYEVGRNRFRISNGTVELPSQNIPPVLTYEDAVKIYDENVKDNETIKSFRKRKPFLILFYSNIYNDWEGDTRREYRLCWVGGYTRCIYIDAQTGQVYKIVNKSKND